MADKPMCMQHAEKWKDDPDFFHEGLLLDIVCNLFNIADEKGLNYAAIANKMNCSTSQVKRTFEGPTCIQLRTIVRLAWALGKRVEVNFVDRIKEDKPNEHKDS